MSRPSVSCAATTACAGIDRAGRRRASGPRPECNAGAEHHQHNRSKRPPTLHRRLIACRCVLTRAPGPSRDEQARRGEFHRTALVRLTPSVNRRRHCSCLISRRAPVVARSDPRVQPRGLGFDVGVGVVSTERQKSASDLRSGGDPEARTIRGTKSGVQRGRFSPRTHSRPREDCGCGTGEPSAGEASAPSLRPAWCSVQAGSTMRSSLRHVDERLRQLRIMDTRRRRRCL